MPHRIATVRRNPSATNNNRNDLATSADHPGGGPRASLGNLDLPDTDTWPVEKLITPSPPSESGAPPDNLGYVFGSVRTSRGIRRGIAGRNWTTSGEMHSLLPRVLSKHEKHSFTEIATVISTAPIFIKRRIKTGHHV